MADPTDTPDDLPEDDTPGSPIAAGSGEPATRGVMPHDGPVIDIAAEMKTAYLDYAMSVIVSRAIPDLRDGLKPVHRRILFAMNETGNTFDKPYRKSARPVGDVMGKYHPHGDTAIYDEQSLRVMRLLDEARRQIGIDFSEGERV